MYIHTEYALVGLRLSIFVSMAQNKVSSQAAATEKKKSVLTTCLHVCTILSSRAPSILAREFAEYASSQCGRLRRGEFADRSVSTSDENEEEWPTQQDRGHTFCSQRDLPHTPLPRFSSEVWQSPPFQG